MARADTPNTITMLEKRAGSHDGIHVAYYEKGETYTVPETIAKMFLLNGWAVVAGTEVPEEKMAPAAAENKMVIPVEENKTADTIEARNEAGARAKGARGK